MAFLILIAAAFTLLFIPAKNTQEARKLAYAKPGPDPRIILMSPGGLTVPGAANPGK
ncbi:hypothetical protein [Acetonema longum]|uniref:Uncharacterized protein n=1 Tax=Acetonema longum DSM 6540 TaxID=1009370 RepID=F7NDY0_9FIRM|nr:hypothetical protein [Acetonema longum]EGO65734.1 hypothetical protein ALO_01210 [Acetonema longum DSM 6540]